VAKLLLVEDDESFRELLSKILRNLGHELTIALHGASGRDMLGLSKFDAIISDIRMPNLSGVELLEWFRTRDTETPFILMTGFSDISSIEEAHQLGATGFLTKPFHEEDIVSTLETVLRHETPSKRNLDREFYRVNIDDFVAGKVIPCSIHIRMNELKYVKIAHANEPLDPLRIEKYRQMAVRFLYMQRDDYERYMAQTLKLASIVKKPGIVSPEVKKRILKHASDLIAQKVFVDGLDENEFKNAQIFSEMALSIMADDPAALGLLDSFSKYSDHLYAHSVASSVYAVIIASQLGWNAPTTVFKVSTCALFHDIGLKEIPIEVLDKPRAEQSAAERRVYESHTSRGLEILSAMPSIPSDVGLVALQHHENIAGTGYPKNLMRSKIHPLAKVVSIADLFCEYALPNKNSPGMSAAQAYERMALSHQDTMDEQSFKALGKVINP
jgi:putative nucleotidyltransferase with HDIG domain